MFFFFLFLIRIFLLFNNRFFCLTFLSCVCSTNAPDLSLIPLLNRSNSITTKILKWNFTWNFPDIFLWRFWRWKKWLERYLSIIDALKKSELIPVRRQTFTFLFKNLFCPTYVLRVLKTAITHSLIKVNEKQT